MAIVTIVEGASGMPSLPDVEQMAETLLADLMQLWVEEHGSFIAGKRFLLMAHPRGAYAPMKDGPIRDRTVLFKSVVPVGFSMTDDPDAERSPYCLRVFEPDPSFVPDGVASPDERLTVHITPPEE